jgi:hypothetical protein
LFAEQEKNIVKHGDVFDHLGEKYLVTFRDGKIYTSLSACMGISTMDYNNNTDSIQYYFDSGIWRKIGNAFDCKAKV